MKITLEEHNLLRELAEEFDYPPFDEGKHVTASMLADKLGMTKRGARDRLDSLVVEGRLKREYIRMPNGYRAWGYYKV
jgi:DNA-binding Lrp family transcriptional regulator